MLVSLIANLCPDPISGGLLIQVLKIMSEFSTDDSFSNLIDADLAYSYVYHYTLSIQYFFVTLRSFSRFSVLFFL